MKNEEPGSQNSVAGIVPGAGWLLYSGLAEIGLAVAASVSAYITASCS